MSGVQIIIFPVYPGNNHNFIPGYNTRDSNIVHNLNFSSTKTSIYLSEILRNVVFEENLKYTQIKNYCSDSDNSTFIIDDLPYDLSCENLMPMLSSLFDVFNEDFELLFHGEEFSVTHYAVVVLFNKEYIGHIYTWMSPINPKLCFAMSIRSSVEFIYKEKILPSISRLTRSVNLLK
jgi:hypothetical protein